MRDIIFYFFMKCNVHMGKARIQRHFIIFLKRSRLLKQVVVNKQLAENPVLQLKEYFQQCFYNPKLK